MFTLPKLDYDYDALGKYISGDIMRLHHDHHHQTYVDKLNAALGKAPSDWRNRSIEDILTNLESAPDDIKTALRNQGGGHYNHSEFWKWMSPNGGGEPSGELGEALKAKYGGYQQFVDQFSEQAAGVFGSGWAWLQPDLSITTSPNQDNPLMSGEPAPLLGLDVWEHAYYLDYTYKRPDYIKAWWNVVNWEYVAEKYRQSR